MTPQLDLQFHPETLGLGLAVSEVTHCECSPLAGKHAGWALQITVLLWTVCFSLTSDTPTPPI